jgi:hypothetical protein
MDLLENLGKMSEGWAGLLGVIGGGAVAEVDGKDRRNHDGSGRLDVKDQCHA